MHDLSQATVAETIYLRKWKDGQNTADCLPYEIIVIETVSEPDQELRTVVRTVPTEQIALMNERAKQAERPHDAEYTVRELQQQEREIETLEDRVALWEHRSRELGFEPKKLCLYRERLREAYRALERIKGNG